MTTQPKTESALNSGCDPAADCPKEYCKTRCRLLNDALKRERGHLARIAELEQSKKAARELNDAAMALIAKREAELEQAQRERDRLDALINSPHTSNFLEATRLEVAHQIERWGTAHDRAKQPQDWYWLLAYLSGKCLRAHIDGDTEKALHHTVSSAAVLANWWAAISNADGRFQPGSGDLQEFFEATFGGSIPTPGEE